MKRIIGLLTAVLMVFPFACGSASAAEIDLESFCLIANYLIKGDEVSYDFGPLIRRFDASIITSPDITFEQLEASCDKAAAAVYVDGEYRKIAHFDLVEDRWVCVEIADAEEDFLTITEEYGPGMLWSYGCSWDVMMDDDLPHTVQYPFRDDILGSEVDSMEEFLQCVSCENVKSRHKTSYVSYRPFGWYDAEDVEYAAEYWRKESYGIWSNRYVRIAVIVAVVAVAAYGVDRLLILREKKRRASK